MDANKYLSRAEAADYLRNRGLPVAHQTLAKLVTTGGGPRFVRFGRKPFYTSLSLEAWVASRLSSEVRSTSELEIA